MAARNDHRAARSIEEQSSPGDGPAQALSEHAGEFSPHQGVTDQPGRERAILAAALDPIITIDIAGTIQSASDSVRRVFGWTPDELIGRNINVLMPEPHHSAHDGYLTKYRRTGETNILNRPRRFDAMRKDGSLIPIELCVSRADLPDEGPPLFVGIVRDMSAYTAAERSRDEERVRAERQIAEQTSSLQQANAKLRMADRMASIGTLAAGLGHDMNNVLLPVRARLNALRASAKSGEWLQSDRKHIEEIRRGIAYLQQLADGLHFLALDPDVEEDARGGGGVTDLHRWWSQTGTLLSKAVPKHVRVVASIPEGLPLVAVPAHGLTQAVLNLVVNAGEAIPNPSERKRRQGLVRVWAERADEPGGVVVRVGVSDNGAGMTEEVKRRAFEMFFTTKPRGMGTGLGLALVRKVVERAGGRIEIKTEVGVGTTVVISLPALPTPDESRTPETLEATITLEDGRAGALIRHLLEAEGVRVRAEQDPSDAAVWITDPTPARLKVAKDWRQRKPDGRLVLVGAIDAGTHAAWEALSPLTAGSSDDFEAVRGAVRKAASGIEKGVKT